MGRALEATRARRLVDGGRAVGAVLQLLPRAWAFAPTLGWFAWISWLSSRPSDRAPGTWWWSVLGNGVHAPLFGLLALFASLGLPRVHGWPRLDARCASLVLAIVLALGAIDELHQSAVAGRDFSALDLVTDVTGAACVLWIARYLDGDAATDAGLIARVAAGIAACTIAAACTTFVGAAFPTLRWL